MRCLREGSTPETRTANVEQQHRLLGQIWELDADVVIADVGTNPADDFVDMFELGAMRLVVSAPDPRSIRRAYNFFKDQVIREVEHVAGGTIEGSLLIGAMGRPNPRPMNDLLEILATKPNVRAAMTLSKHLFAGLFVSLAAVACTVGGPDPSPTSSSSSSSGCSCLAAVEADDDDADLDFGGGLGFL